MAFHCYYVRRRDRSWEQGHPQVSSIGTDESGDEDVAEVQKKLHIKKSKPGKKKRKISSLIDVMLMRSVVGVLSTD